MNVLAILLFAVAAAVQALPQYATLQRNLTPMVKTKPLVPGHPKAEKAAGRIVNGAPASLGQFPYQASVIMDYSYMCGGSLISASVVLTAGHCASGLHRTGEPAFSLTGEQQLRGPDRYGQRLGPQYRQRCHPRHAAVHDTERHVQHAVQRILRRSHLRLHTLRRRFQRTEHLQRRQRRRAGGRLTGKLHADRDRQLGFGQWLCERRPGRLHQGHLLPRLDLKYRRHHHSVKAAHSSPAVSKFLDRRNCEQYRAPNK
ncbi:uncharacterized protein LOC126236697 isoform X6 [Schistocerca nitens]|uniref:uncharacterized protein LOC126236697 isoform X6 n=1 Tax=Schistocerca nitens TaxID=7011 RepID=UPI00211903BD|nr:uncharacterized protein LOC126236697 isoform X6 [Schistocerca nitens]